jgi:ribokinase
VIQDASVLVVGSVNCDITVRTARFPAPGETVAGGPVLFGLGGKGANQAVASARTGVRTGLLGTVGADEHGPELLRILTEAGVDTSLVTQAAGYRTGIALITVDNAGENQIVVASGANETTTAQRVRAASSALGDASVIITQGEVPVEAIEALVESVREEPVIVVLNLAPFVEVPATVLKRVDVLVVNETEAGQMLGGSAPDTASQALDAARSLTALSRSAVITLGDKGAVFAERDGTARHMAVPAPVRVVDATGAGDAFVGVLASELAVGSSLDAAVASGIAAASRTVQVAGAAQSYPDFARKGTPRQ